MDYLALAIGIGIGILGLCIFNHFFVVSRRRFGDNEPLKYYLPAFGREGHFEIPATEAGERILSSIMVKTGGGVASGPIKGDKPQASNGNYV